MVGLFKGKHINLGFIFQTILISYGFQRGRIKVWCVVIVGAVEGSWKILSLLKSSSTNPSKTQLLDLSSMMTSEFQAFNWRKNSLKVTLQTLQANNKKNENKAHRWSKYKLTANIHLSKFNFQMMSKALWRWINWGVFLVQFKTKRF